MSWDVINPSISVEAARISGSHEALSRAFRGAGLRIDDEFESIANARDPKFWKSRIRVVKLVDSLHWLLPYLR